MATEQQTANGSASVPAAAEAEIPSSSKGRSSTKDAAPKKPKVSRLVLCFDGTGNKFTGDTSDTNIVKIYQLLDRGTKGQFHYYQPGIGTYVTGTSSFTPKLWSRFTNYITQTLDEALGTSFADHVVSGYKFIMRYYTPGDDIYILGFSRGAYTARFLAQMVQTIGLLSRGNEEMINFAWDTYAKYEQRGTDTDHKAEAFMEIFRDTFCRKDVTIRFLGLFDSVNSVGSFEIPGMRRSFDNISIPPAIHVRHAVSIDERRAKFKPALFDDRRGHDIKEVWFPGNHGDVGGGWVPGSDGHLLSDIPLAWMINEMKNLPDVEKPLVWLEGAGNIPHHDPVQSPHVARTAVLGKIHDALGFAKGFSLGNVFGWWLIEWIPIFSRRELEDDKWVSRRVPPNGGEPRDLPSGALIHPTAHVRELEDPNYRPKNTNYRSAISPGQPASRKKESSWRTWQNELVGKKWHIADVHETEPLLNGSGNSAAV
ncbi:unnamed protein product [Tuber melanosporum]|jgi:uncharacterized protein (DUF2235 family)|uniref:(Perigord truffle) hypothetical protein n=1 Tax=Tuber melanosporum (strain Mel28) TaxID=656061 RepID=D5GFH0_TUBMM|nr:uncharacterized protein GSTUM_00006890001 [Tuber melanosporum]CAZ83263.1 unnamed protein product [Tuber melanosporum]